MLDVSYHWKNEFLIGNESMEHLNLRGKKKNMWNDSPAFGVSTIRP